MGPTTAGAVQIDDRRTAKRLAEYRAEHVPLFNKQPVKLGLFSINASGNVFFSDVPGRYDVSWAHSTAVAKIADDIGFEAFVPVGRWRGFGGEMNYNAVVYETLTYAAGIAASTHNIMTFATVHASLIHPIHAAKAIATIDHISGGRAGLNLVMGWYEKEMRMFGADLRPHDDRYAYGAEWTDIVERLWTEPDHFDHHGRYFDLEGLESLPKPIQPRPVLFNAGGSPAGTDFAARYADFNFTTFVTKDQATKYVSNIRAKAQGYGRDIGVVTNVVVVCRDTEDEARAAYQSIIDHGDLEAVSNFMTGLNLQTTFKENMSPEARANFAASAGSYALIGTPEQVATGFKQIEEAGIDCVLLGMIDYVKELEYFGEKVMPLLKDIGVRI
jgi:alkanesulfonate monooxygenase SsuD/methylene tetrahydromethanopterin reductase-like flavin-dependent oxidoreductase (luciferase family)